MSDIKNKAVVVVYKQSRYTYVLTNGSDAEKESLQGQLTSTTKDLYQAHKNNLACLDKVEAHLKSLGVRYEMVCRSDLKQGMLDDKMIVVVGGDGTVLEASHHSKDSPILGVNSDPISSIGALCATTCDDFSIVLSEIYQGTIKPISLRRLAVRVDDVDLAILPVNDILFCHKNPATMTRFVISLNGHREFHRSSGIWVATAAGSTGGIYSSGANELPLDDDRAIFRMREPYWVDCAKPSLLSGYIENDDILTIESSMMDGELYLDGPHKSFAVPLGGIVAISLAQQPLWLFDGPRLKKNRMQIIEQRQSIRRHLS